MNQPLQSKKRVMFNLDNSTPLTMAKGKTLEDPIKEVRKPVLVESSIFSKKQKNGIRTPRHKSLRQLKVGTNWIIKCLFYKVMKH